jgi:hypothetical protein
MKQVKGLQTFETPFILELSQLEKAHVRSGQSQQTREAQADNF